MHPKTTTLRKLFRARVETPRPLTQVDRIVLAFGGVTALRNSLAKAGVTLAPSTVYRWNYPRSKRGRDGIIPLESMKAVLAAARNEGIMLTSEHLDPRPNFGESVTDILTAETKKLTPEGEAV